ncbi:hypothetical protein ACTXT7_002409 [Hymenolepis weldensis]
MPKSHFLNYPNSPHTCKAELFVEFVIRIAPSFSPNTGLASNLRNYGPAITVINYVCSIITIIALSLFLCFSRFVGVFRLDQFHIALSLLLGTVVSLFIPHVPEDFEFLCAVIAVLANYFPLCAFAWKFVFGLNALLMM